MKKDPVVKVISALAIAIYIITIILFFFSWYVLITEKDFGKSAWFLAVCLWNKNTADSMRKTIESITVKRIP